MLNWQNLTAQEASLLCADIEEIEAEEGLSFEDSERLLEQRIGGQRNLESYVRCLEAGYNLKVRKA